MHEEAAGIPHDARDARRASGYEKFATAPGGVCDTLAKCMTLCMSMQMAPS
jgi:hypothetical protein